MAHAGDSAGEPSCWSSLEPASDLDVRSLGVPGGAEALGGVSTPAVRRLLAGFENGGTVDTRTSDIAGADLCGWAVPVGAGRTERVIGYTSDHRIVAVLDAQGDSASVLADVNTQSEQASPSDEVSLLNEVATGPHAGYGRMAFRFRDGLPGYEVSYEQRPIRAAGSGDEVDVAGEAVIVVRMELASGRERTGEGERTYTGRERIKGAGTYALDEVVRVGDFEGVLTWAIGVSQELPFRVEEHGDVLVVDVRHPEG